jgi:hypothetical protein
MKKLADSVKESMIGARSLIPAWEGMASLMSLPVPSESRK